MRVMTRPQTPYCRIKNKRMWLITPNYPMFCCDAWIFYGVNNLGIPFGYDPVMRFYYVLGNRTAKTVKVFDRCLYCYYQWPSDLSSAFKVTLEREFNITTKSKTYRTNELPEEFKSDAWWLKREGHQVESAFGLFERHNVIRKEEVYILEGHHPMYCCEDFIKNCIADFRSLWDYNPVKRYFFTIHRTRTTREGEKYSECWHCRKEWPKDLSKEYDKILDKEFGITPDSDAYKNNDVPEEFKTEEWWRKRGL